MAAPTFTLFERNGASAGTLTPNVPQVAYAAVDVASTSALSAANQIAPSGFSFEKYNGLQVATVATTAISAMSFYFAATAPVDSAAVVVPIKYAATATYVAPVAIATTVAGAAAISANVTAPGITMTVPANTAASNSSYAVTQLQAGAAAAGGPLVFPSPYLVFQYTWS